MLDLRCSGSVDGGLAGFFDPSPSPPLPLKGRGGWRLLFARDPQLAPLQPDRGEGSGMRGETAACRGRHGWCPRMLDLRCSGSVDGGLAGSFRPLTPSPLPLKGEGGWRLLFARDPHLAPLLPGPGLGVGGEGLKCRLPRAARMVPEDAGFTVFWKR
jgi:hypothetical protein